MAKSDKTFKVALNVANAEATSWYCPITGVNLFLNKPISADLSEFDDEELEAVYRGIKAGLLIIAAGDMPSEIDVAKIERYASPRRRTPDELSDVVTAAQAHHKSLISKAKTVAKEVKTATS